MGITDRRRLWALWAGAGLYFLVLLNGLRYVGELPNLAIAFGTLLNVAIFTTFVIAIRRAHTGKQNQAERETSEGAPSVMTDARRRKIRALWIGAGLYFVAMLAALQYATRLPPQFLAPAGILNMGIVVTFVLKLRNAYLPKKQ